MTLIELAKQLNCSTAKAEEVLAANSLTISDVDETFIPSLKAEMDKSALSTGVNGSSQSLATQSTVTNSSIKSGKLAPKKEGAIATSKRGSSKVAKSVPVEKAQIEKASTRALIKDLEVGAIEEAATAGYNADTGKLAAIAYVSALQMRVADDVAVMMPKAINGIFASIGEVSDTRYQGIFDNVRINEEPEEVSIDWSL